ncbi:putative phosphatase regulatory subunit-domain-containing protein [Mucor mucedo]|uniref:putative phosphatase regulatory subunit-domain-containing protein n=1 Tax=Mucor mucedo TaxID=29922 RepID=UPI00221E824A|nr:putative phosphatase regulatory subunit-domain-containing protein [Mucor mucedo]KAI7896468.1 putative phosphatase regulatory subunit-domain-containing protein [Mucor mucedo]
MNCTLPTHSSLHQPPSCGRRVLLKRPTHAVIQPKKKKSVRFEGDQVRYFYKNQTPLAVKTDPPFMDRSVDDYKLSLPNWPTRNTIFYNTEQKIRMESVTLVNGDTDLMSQNMFMIEGRCRALNLSFHKIVSIRYSFDLWRSFSETTGEFRESIASTSNTWDRFIFHIPIQPKEETQTLYLALRYTVDEGEFWDNNNGMNYQVIITPNEPIATTTEELAIIRNNTKVLGRRYDFSTSLTEASRKPFGFASPPPSPPGTPVENENLSYTPPVFFGNDVETTTTTTPPASPPISSAEGFGMSYSDFVDKYCFYNSNPIYSSFSPSAVLS